MTPEELVELALRRVAARRYAMIGDLRDRDPMAEILIEIADEIAKIMKERGGDG